MPEPITQTKYKVYLGDGAFVDWDEGLQQVKLTAENGLEATNAIYLEAHAMGHLAVWWEMLIKELRCG